MHTDDAVFDLATTPQPLPRDADGSAAALGRSRFVKAADRFRMSVLTGDQPLTVVAYARLIPLDRFHETL